MVSELHIRCKLAADSATTFCGNFRKWVRSGACVSGCLKRESLDILGCSHTSAGFAVHMHVFAADLQNIAKVLI